MKPGELIGTIAGSFAVFLIGLFIVIKYNKNKSKKAPAPQRRLVEWPPRQEVLGSTLYSSNGGKPNKKSNKKSNKK